MTLERKLSPTPMGIDEYISEVSGNALESDLIGLLKGGDCQGVEKFNISGSDLSRRGSIDALVKFFNTAYNLQEVNLSDCKLASCSDEQFLKLIKSLNKISLKTLNLSGNLMRSNSVEDQDLRLKAVSQLVHDISFNGMRDKKDGELKVDFTGCGISLGEQALIRERTVRKKAPKKLSIDGDVQGDESDDQEETNSVLKFGDRPSTSVVADSSKDRKRASRVSGDDKGGCCSLQ